MFKMVMLTAMFLSSLALAKHHEEKKEMLQKLQETCAADVKTLCADIEPGDKRILKCLRKNREKVSDVCKAALKEAKHDMKHMKHKKNHDKKDEAAAEEKHEH